MVSGSQIPIVSLILDSCRAEFRIPNPGIPDATCKNFPDSVKNRLPVPCMGLTDKEIIRPNVLFSNKVDFMSSSCF